ncbi:bifunctional hydroxymethylpyrimidine kinase/phosphomethylpyrimidine kinase [Vibrio sp.]|uniref:hydroxymethylpyrimidine kinase n=1 Tax=Vibrio viridaestus TaxID=2487322 RepID=A0A3N9TE84_9VIBR|nr:bifunctional hydroxymethylpyrimidine kinase/phosphomethylpyrimidine kinase [Vibrio viridaestus]MDC0609536.1 bifunctional hydroxymethylpyrimidine kinase/phosphomethylpyrimidine kinase [Vibrio sp.]RQW62013.1 bifunctional hydroxymethylpyrimidine kinase/phosphomethylpyrimidine kinase [Vibrio viridaestus]
MTLIKSNVIPVVLTIAGSDSGGGAGIQADIKAISATGSYACSVITAVTSQNTQGVQAICPIPLEHIASQLDSVFTDLNIAVVKIGMLADSAIIKLVAEKLRDYSPKQIVLDPVMVATSGDLLLKSNAIEDLIEYLLPLATLITPNVPEALALINKSPEAFNGNLNDLIEDIRELPINAALLKGGHLNESTDSVDLLVQKHTAKPYSSTRINTNNTHGTGCTLSSAIASYLAQGYPLVEAVDKAKRYITEAIRHADELNIGRGHGPVHHFYVLNK